MTDIRNAHRHIPERDIRTLGDISFEKALKMAQEPNAEYDTERWLFVPNYYTEYRYILGTRGKHPLICVGINPSTAKPGALDPTLQSVERIALGNGYDSFIMFNVYAQRATRPDDMDKELCCQLHMENLSAFRYILSLSPTPNIWAAWGTIIEKRSYLPACVRDMVRVGKEFGARWYTAGKRTKRGHPHHPLYLRADEKMALFDVDAYLNSLHP